MTVSETFLHMTTGQSSSRAAGCRFGGQKKEGQGKTVIILMRIPLPYIRCGLFALGLSVLPLGKGESSKTTGRNLFSPQNFVSSRDSDLLTWHCPSIRRRHLACKLPGRSLGADDDEK